VQVATSSLAAQLRALASGAGDGVSVLEAACGVLLAGHSPVSDTQVSLLVPRTMPMALRLRASSPILQMKRDAMSVSLCCTRNRACVLWATNCHSQPPECAQGYRPLTPCWKISVCGAQASEEQLWDLDAAALRLVAALLRNDPACRIAVRGLDHPAAAARPASAGRGSRLSLRGSGGGGDGSLQAEQLALLTGDSGRSGSGRFGRRAHLSRELHRWTLLKSKWTFVRYSGTLWV